MAKKQHDSSEYEKRLREIGYSDESIKQFVRQAKELEKIGKRLDVEMAHIELSDYDFSLSDDYEVFLLDSDLDFLLI